MRSVAHRGHHSFRWAGLLSLAACLPWCAFATSPVVHPDRWPVVPRALPANPALEASITELLAHMSVEDKVGQLIQADISTITPDDLKTYRLGSVLAGGNSGPGGNDFASAAQWKAMVARFHAAALQPESGHSAIPLLFGIDAVHGNNNLIGATLFPQNSALGATRDVELIRQIGHATAEEVRAIGIDWTFAPTLAVPQDDRWGRTYEGYAQDPALVASYATAMVDGLQGTAGSKAFLGNQHVVATAKHFLGDGGTFEGRDQGDARVSEEVLRDVHAAGYVTAIAAGVQTVMASFSSWNGVKMHGDHALLTDVLKQRMGFDGFVVGDWNAHGQLDGCSNESCAAAINAGVDMLMAPDSWRGLYANTLAQVKAGQISPARLDDAVTRVLRVKLRAGLFDPRHDNTGGLSLATLGSPEHRALARRAVRESLVLLKNRGGVLPIDPRANILVAGGGADNVSQQSGGWTITWQGTGLNAAQLPGAQSIWSGIEQKVVAAGGTATLSADGSYVHKPDLAIVVFGEQPYAEFQGDLKSFAYRNGDDANLDLLLRLKHAGIPVVAVFLAGRPLWVNREINAADAFVMAWLPGSEGGGVADVLMRKPDGSVATDFRGKLSYAWPRTAIQVAQAPGEKPQFAYGYGLTYADHDETADLSEASGLVGEQAVAGIFMTRGKPTANMQLTIADAGGAARVVDGLPARSVAGNLQIVGVDYHAQEDARRIQWNGAGGSVVLRSTQPVNLERETNGDMMLVMSVRADVVPAAGDVSLGVDCAVKCTARIPFRAVLAQLPRGQWRTVGIALKCMRKAGATMSALQAPFVLESHVPLQVSLSQVRLDTHADTVLPCPRG
ncbi:glycoside hydrolase family 3 N-terminal domain-containing protein [Rhodanobacter sp. AS-Z3]|uniref:glycoside hydrolase family 3 protein n=1 Tax=Rhodanobacter sp. AS-Z3 TaxID=3031330 RepID=UPI002478C6B7|nr:glycoside hydrolase family 3 protein [Rhodanobacter sp. AS-Z3]WEN14660.1 glycoside hydrolase family 3 N-terminal domain-containing protein [Rhodanobacter sp. AS-Z3]